jgi:hypothetical protein
MKLLYADESLPGTPVYEPLYSDRALALATNRKAGQVEVKGATVGQLKPGVTRKVLYICASSEPIRMPRPPALYTERQSVMGQRSYRQNCARCHGLHLDGQMEGGVAPALRGAAFAGSVDSLRVSEIFRIIVKRMPASSPGSLPPAADVEIMAYILQQNGYPAGRRELTYDSAANSMIPILYYKMQPAGAR